MSELFLGIDTSNYTTSSALFDGERVLENRKMLPVKQGGDSPKRCGLSSCAAAAPGAGPYFGGVGRPPQSHWCIPGSHNGGDLICHASWWGKTPLGFWGRQWKVPVEGFSHQQGHIAAALYSAGKLELLEERFLAFHVSGGTTEALLVTPGEKGVPQVKRVAHSLDLKAGQAVGVWASCWGSGSLAAQSWNGWP